MPEQTPQQPIPECFYKADRERAHVGLSPFQLAYVERLENALKASDAYVEAMSGFAHSPAQHSLENNLLIQMSKVNFLSSTDLIEDEVGELPREIIWS